MFLLMPPYRKRIYKTALTKDEISARLNNEFVAGITSAKYGKYNGTPVLEHGHNKTFQLVLSSRENETVAELSFIKHQEFQVIYAASPLRQSILLIFLIAAIVYLIVAGSGAGAFIGVFALYILMIALFSINFFFHDADTIEKFVNDRLLA